MNANITQNFCLKYFLVARAITRVTYAIVDAISLLELDLRVAFASANVPLRILSNINKGSIYLVVCDDAISLLELDLRVALASANVPLRILSNINKGSIYLVVCDDAISLLELDLRVALASANVPLRILSTINKGSIYLVVCDDSKILMVTRLSKKTSVCVHHSLRNLRKVTQQ